MFRPDIKACTRCLEQKAISEFYACSSNKDGFQYRCKSCQRIIASSPKAKATKTAYELTPERKQREKETRKVRDSTPEGRRKIALSTIRRHYGFSGEEYLKMEKQAKAGGCPICGVPYDERKFHIDHDHSCCSGIKSCGKCVRDFICQRCNTLLGMANDEARVLDAAILYLRKHKEKIQ